MSQPPQTTTDDCLNNAIQQQLESPPLCVEPNGELTLQTICMPADTNWMGDIFGGWLVSQMDIAGAICARKRSCGRVITVAINDMVFHVPVHVGDVITCFTTIERVGRTSLTVFIEVWTRLNPERDTVKVTEGRFVFVAIDEMGNKRCVPPESDCD